MRLKRIYLYGLLLLLPAMTVSCDKDPGEPGAVEKVTLDISTYSLLAGDAGDPDNALTSVRIMAFYRAGTLASNRYVTMAEADPPLSIQLELEVGYYDFVFIVNEDSDGGRLTAILDGYTGKALSDLYGEYFASAAFRSDYSIPMVRLIRNVTVLGDNDILVDESPVTTPWEVEVERTGIRVDLVMQTAFESMATGFTELQVVNVPDKVYVFGEGANLQPVYNVAGTGSFESPLPSYRKFASNRGDLYDTPAELAGEDVYYTITAADTPVEFVQKGDKWYWYKRLILPETVFTPAGTESLGMQLRAVANGKTYTLTLSDAAGTDFTLPRNSRYLVNGTLKTDYVEFSVGVIDWGANTFVDIPLE